MKHQDDSQGNAEANPIVALVRGIDRDVERGKNVLMLGLSR